MRELMDRATLGKTLYCNRALLTADIHFVFYVVDFSREVTGMPGPGLPVRPPCGDSETGLNRDAIDSWSP